MNKTIMGAVIIVVLVIIGAVGVKLVMPLFEDRHQKITSDATKTKGKIKIAVDNWIGYFPLQSQEMKQYMRQAGWNLICEDDHADYDQRMARLKAGEIDFAVATVDSYILNGARYNFPGAIIMVIDESKGGDAIVALEKKVASLDDLKGKKNIKVAFTPDSPSHHLAKATADHFSVPELLPAGNLRIETDGSEKAREKLFAGEADVAILWEPDVSYALNKKQFVKILGTEDTEKLIVDILIADRDFAKQNPEVVTLLLTSYFRTLKKFREDPKSLYKQVEKATKLSDDSIESMLKGVKWANFIDNCEKWFGIDTSVGYAYEGLIDTIESTVSILTHSGDFSKNPIPDDDPFRLTNSSFLEMMLQQGIDGFSIGIKNTSPGPANTIEARFSPLDAAGWDSLKEVGTLKVEPIIFQHGTTELDLFAKKVVDEAVERLKHYPNFRLKIKGHTDTRGNEQENIRLSSERADAVARYLTVIYNIDSNRIRAIGLGGAKPLKRKPGESLRAWQYSLPRVELVLVREDY
jgi:outer membrane protein OmpA-like peptidoglycan-associated protein/ABC-type nitrate/sulfonate/bicarbonate transport system substrate-binding protein